MNSHLRLSYPFIADGVYKAGFAATQEPYTKAVHELFKALDKAEGMLKGRDYLVGNQLTEADVRLWVTTVSIFLSWNSNLFIY